MRHPWLHGIAGAVLVALSMQVVNSVFEAAGSVPDLDSCAFLAGNLQALLLLYPTLACLILRRLGSHAGTDAEGPERAARFGAAVGLGGALLYFAVGLIALARNGDLEALSPALAGWIIAFLLLSAAGGALGAASRSGAIRIAARFGSRG